MADYWIKLYHEILDDPKMATMPDRLWRRTIEVFLLAGKLSKDKSGVIPDTRQLAWLLRMDTNDLQGDMEQIASAGLLESVPNGWKVINFEKRQKAATAAERVKQSRERKQKQQYYDDVTDLSRNVTQINRVQSTESDTEADTETTSSSEISILIQAYEKEIGAITQTVSEMLVDDLEDYGLTHCLEAIKIAVSQNKRKWAYVRGILKNQWVGDKIATTPEIKEPKITTVIFPDGTTQEVTL